MTRDPLHGRGARTNASGRYERFAREAYDDGWAAEEVRPLLDSMAVEGGTDVDGRHQAVDDLNELLNTLRGTAGSVVPCEFTFRDPPEDLGGLQILIDGVLVPRDTSHVNGWDLAAELLTFYGAACDGLRDGQAHVIEAEGGCP